MFSNLIVIMMLGAVILALIVFAVVGIPYIIGKVFLRIRIVNVILEEPDPWLAGWVVLIIGALLLFLGMTAQMTLKS